MRDFLDLDPADEPTAAAWAERTRRDRIVVYGGLALMALLAALVAGLLVFALTQP